LIKNDRSQTTCGEVTLIYFRKTTGIRKNRHKGKEIEELGIENISKKVKQSHNTSMEAKGGEEV
jgi:hypothetical protein